MGQQLGFERRCSICGWGPYNSYSPCKCDRREKETSTDFSTDHNSHWLDEYISDEEDKSDQRLWKWSKLAGGPSPARDGAP